MDISNSDPDLTVDPRAAAFSIMFVSVGFSCFIWQSLRSGWMFYKIRKPIHGIVFAQAVLGVILTFCTLLTSLVYVDCHFILIFSIVGVNLGDIALQSVLLWKAYLGNNRSKIILMIGCIPLIGLVVFIICNVTVAQSIMKYRGNVCTTSYPIYIVIAKAALDFTSNTFLSWCFILVIYRHYQVLVLGGSSPILYTIDWYLASYLIIKQLKYGRNGLNEEDGEDNDDDDDDDDSRMEDDDGDTHSRGQISRHRHTMSCSTAAEDLNQLHSRPLSFLLKNEIDVEHHQAHPDGKKESDRNQG
ncbi:hypothetical protein BDB00DRAFT_952033 [Zychaea mexicana]|uniref:uncharacterized protein n=1 Tax=Zychaea mexicana TaxID=64656 RepID=UPI0022FE7B38|nr:uncharacterized protein BDB00DRAFT_952033 [Zychaea mexicana]KAI9496931.1 hypothetical protein BDB00DRAFT_952033 [Zychaea mexicana]